MYCISVSLLVMLSAAGYSYGDQVNAAAAYNRVGQYYSQGCSGLVAELLGRPWQKANAYSRGEYIGSNGAYSGVSSGEIVGFPGHVAVYVGYQGCRFVDVPGPKRNARCLNSYGGQKVYKVYYD